MAGANVFKVPVLKVTTGDKVLLNSRSAKQEICPTLKETLKRNVNSELIKNNAAIKLKSIIETKDDVNITAIRKSMESKDVCKIYSMVQFCSHSTPRQGTYVEDSVETDDGIITYRPILDVILTNFSCKATSDGEQVWKLEFEEP